MLVRQLLEREEDVGSVRPARGRRVPRTRAGRREKPLIPPGSCLFIVFVRVAFRYTETSPNTRPKEKRTLFLMNTGAFTSALQPYLFPRISLFLFEIIL